jgi:hypothetical protein
MRFDLPWVQVWAMDRGAIVRPHMPTRGRTSPPSVSDPLRLGQRASSKHSSWNTASISFAQRYTFPVLSCRAPTDPLIVEVACQAPHSYLPRSNPHPLIKCTPWPNHSVFQPPVDACCLITRRTKGDCFQQTPECVKLQGQAQTEGSFRAV